MQKLCNRRLRSATALTMALALTVSGFTVTDAKAASKNEPTLSKTKISLVKGNSKVVKIKKSKKVTVKKVTWKISSGAKVVKLTNKSKTQVKINALKKGTATVVAKIKVGKKTYTKKVKVTVTAPSKPKNTKTPDVDKTTAPDITETPPVDNTGNPDITNTPVVDNTDTPNITDAPAVSDTPATDAPQETSKPTPTPKRVWVTNQPVPTLAPDELGGTPAEKASWNKGTICSLSPLYTGKKMKITLQVRVRGVEDPSGNMQIQSNYNGYPTFATIPLTTEWTPVEIEYRFNNFTNDYPVMYVSGDDVTDDMVVYYKDLQFEVLEEADPLGGEPVAPNQYNMVSIKSLREGTGATPQKYYENKSVSVSFKLREKGLEDPTGKTVDIQTNANGYVTLKSAVALTTAWTDVEFDYTFGEITNEYPSIYFSYDKDTASEEGIEFFIKDVVITVTGEVTPTPTPEVTEAPTNPTGESHSVYIQDATGYDAAKGGVVISTAGATAWGGAYSKYGANYNLTDKTFASVVVEAEFYKDNAKVTPTATNLQLVIASDSNWGSNGEKTADISAGTTTIDGTNLVANTLVFQWKKAEADITEYDTVVIKSISLVEAPEITNPPAGESHSVYIQDATGYDAAKGGVVISTAGATAWGGAYSKYGANYNLTDKTFASVVVEAEFYKDDVKVTPTATNLQLVIASDSNWGSNGEKTADIANGTTTIEGTNLVANTLVFQWKKSEADITEYDTVIVKSISLVEAPAS